MNNKINKNLLQNITVILILLFTLSGCFGDKEDDKNILVDEPKAVIQDVKTTDNVVSEANNLLSCSTQRDEMQNEFDKILEIEIEKVQNEGNVACEEQIGEMQLKNEKRIEEMNDSLQKRLIRNVEKSNDILKKEVIKMEGEVEQATKDELIYLRAEVKRLNELKTCK